MMIYRSVDEVVSDVERDLGVPLRLEGEELKIDGLRYFINRIFGRKVKPRTQQQIPQEEVYSWVYAENLTPEELRRSKLSDDLIVSIHVYFRSLAGRSYDAAHNWYPEKFYLKNDMREAYTRPETSQIRLGSFDKGIDDFKLIEKILKKVTGGNPEGRILDHGNEISRDTYLRERITQARVASFTQEYALHFREVNIGRAAYTDVPISSVENSGLPLEKLSIIKSGEYSRQRLLPQ